MPAARGGAVSGMPPGDEAGTLFYDVVRRRRSVRRFESRPVEEERLRRVMEVGRMAASAANRQPWRFFLLRGEKRREFGSLLREHFRAAPVLIVACACPREAWVRRHDGANYAWLDVGIAVTEMVLAATAEGLGTCWVASFDPAAARRILGLGDEWDPVTALAVGYPGEHPEPGEKKRKGREDVWKVL